MLGRLPEVSESASGGTGALNQQDGVCTQCFLPLALGAPQTALRPHLLSGGPGFAHAYEALVCNVLLAELISFGGG